MRLLVMTLACCFCLAAPALAQEPASVDIGKASLDVGVTHLSLPVTCSQPADGQTACPMLATVSWQKTKKYKWAPKGARHVAATEALTVPAGQTQDLDLTIPASKLRDPVSKSGAAAIVDITLTDPAGAELNNVSVYAGPPTADRDCGQPTFIKVAEGTLDEQQVVDNKLQWSPLKSADLAVFTSYRVTSESASFEFNGLTYTLTKGSIFAVSCAGLTDYHRGRFFPVLALDDGRVEIKGSPKGRVQYAGAAMTLEGNLGSRKPEKIDIVVTRDAKRRISTMHVLRGTSGQITTLFKGLHSSPCTNGTALSVDREGRIKTLR